MTETKAHEMNMDFAEKATSKVLENIHQRVEKERSEDGFSFEAYYSIDIPYATGTDEYEYFDKLLGEGSLKNPNYLDLFEQMLKLFKAGLKKEGVKHFITLNCRFDRSLEDNFLLYTFIS